MPRIALGDVVRLIAPAGDYPISPVPAGIVGVVSALEDQVAGAILLPRYPDLREWDYEIQWQDYGEPDDPSKPLPTAIEQMLGGVEVLKGPLPEVDALIEAHGGDTQRVLLRALLDPRFRRALREELHAAFSPGIPLPDNTDEEGV